MMTVELYVNLLLHQIPNVDLHCILDKAGE